MKKKSILILLTDVILVSLVVYNIKDTHIHTHASVLIFHMYRMAHLSLHLSLFSSSSFDMNIDIHLQVRDIDRIEKDDNDDDEKKTPLRLPPLYSLSLCPVSFFSVSLNCKHYLFSHRKKINVISFFVIYG